MEVAACVKHVNSHAASLLASLNLQRTQAQLCDCVVRQRQNPGRLYPAHRCVLAAASPVLATLLSSTGALVELQAPCISDAVLELLLDYIYTGVFPHFHSQQQYCSLLAATGHLEMDELQEALKHWQQTEMDEAIHTTRTENDHCTTVGVLNSSNCIQEMPQIPHVQNNQSNFGACILSRADRVRQKDQCPSSVELGTKLEKLRDWELVRTMVDRRSLYSPDTAETGEDERTQQSHKTQENRKQDKPQSSHLPPFNPTDRPSSPSFNSQSCGAVPVICHSSRVPLLQMSRISPYCPANQASASSRSAPVSRSASTDSTDGGITPKPSYVKQNPDYRDTKDHSVAAGFWDDSCSWDRCDSVTQDYNTSGARHCIIQKDENMNSVLSHISRHNSYCESLCSEKSTAMPRVDSVLQSSDCSHFKRDLKRKTDSNLLDNSFKSQTLECQEISMVAGEDRSIHTHELRTSVTLPGEDTYVKKETQFEKDSKSPDETDQQDNHSGPQTDPYSNSHEAIRTKDTATTDRRRSADLHFPICTTGESNLHTFTGGISTSGHRIPLELEQILNIEITDTYAFPKPTDSNISDSKYSDEGTSYRGHLRYHCLPQRNTHSDHKHAGFDQTGQVDPEHSDLSSDGDEFGIVNGAGHKHGFTRGTANQVLLLDISTKPAELLVSYQHGCIEGEEGIAFDEKNTNKDGLEDNEPCKATFRVGKRKMSADFGPESFDKTELWIKEHNVTAGEDQRKPRAEIIHRTRSWDMDEASIGGENENSTSKAGTNPSMPDYAQSIPATLSVCVPSAVPHSMPTNTSPHLSTPVHHPFQCSLCDRSFSQRGSLNRHVRSHLGVRPFPCPRCPMTFSRQYRVTEHMRVHERMPLGNDFEKPPASSI